MKVCDVLNHFSNNTKARHMNTLSSSKDDVILKHQKEKTNKKKMSRFSKDKRGEGK